MLQKKGITLTELLVYIGIFSLVSVASTSFIWSAMNNQSKQQSLSEVGYNGMFVLDKLRYNTKRANKINTSTSQFGSQLGKLVLVDYNNQTTTFDTFQTQVENNNNSKLVTTTKLRMKKDGLEFTDITSDRIKVNKFTIKNFSNSTGTIRVILNLERLNPSGNKYYEAQKKWKSTYNVK